MYFVLLTILDIATSWLNIVELPTHNITYVLKYGKELVEVIIDKTSEFIARSFDKLWVTRYPRDNSIIYYNGRNFKFFF